MDTTVPPAAAEPKLSVDHHEVIEKESQDDNPSALEAFHSEDEVDPKLTRRMLLKMDLVLMPLMALYYLLGTMDRANIGNARVAGMQTDLGMTDHQYQIAITITYVPYIAAELPSNLMLKKIGPRILLPFLCTSWGIVTTLTSQIHNYQGLLACRFFLGLMEGGLFPGIILYLSGFYRRHETQFRIAIFFSASAFSGAFSGLLAAGLQQMDGLGNMRGWQWIFCIEGLLTIVVGVGSHFVLPNTPSDFRFFKPEEAAHCVRRHRLDVDLPEHEPITVKRVLSAFTSSHLVMQYIVQFSGGALVFGLAYFTPSIVLALGFSPTHTQLLTVPPFVFACILTLFTARMADKYRQRGILVIATSCVSLVGLIMFYRCRTFAPRYVSLCLLITGVFASCPGYMAWISNNVAANTRRATAIALAYIISNIGGIVSTWIFPKSDAPYYPFGAKFYMALLCISMVAIAINIFILRHKNALKRDPEWREMKLRDVKDLPMAEQLAHLGDSHPDFIYTY